MKSFKATIREARARLGTSELARLIGIPAPSLRRCLSTGQWSDAVRAKAQAALKVALKAKPKAKKPKAKKPKAKKREERADARDGAPDTGIELDEGELDELAELWGVSADEVEDLLAVLDDDFEQMTLPDVQLYIDDMRDALEAQGFDIEVSDLWDMYYGYAPGYSGKAA